MPPWRALTGPKVRYVGKVTLAALIAYALTLGGRNEYALFSALGAAMVVGGSVGEDLASSLNRVRGTLAGTAVGIAAASLLGTSIGALGLAVAAVASASVAFAWGAPAMRVGIAMALVVVFTHTSDAMHYASWRAGNTMIGVAVGVLVSRFLWPIHGRDEVHRAIGRALAASAEALEAMAQGAASEALRPQQVAVLDAMTAVRAARKNAKIEARVRSGGDGGATRVRPGFRIAVSVLGASVKLDELVHDEAPAECIASVREFMGMLASAAHDASAAPLADELARRGEQLRRGAAAASPDVRLLLEGVLADLVEIDAALADLRREHHDAAAG